MLRSALRRAPQHVSVVLVVLALIWQFSPSSSVELASMIAWDLLAFAYAALRWWRAWRARRRPQDDPDRRWLAQLPGRWTARLNVVVAPVAGFAGALLIVTSNLFTGGGGDSNDRVALQVAGVAVVVASWLLLHLGFADVYAQHYYPARDGEASQALRPLAFPETPSPNELDFAYFAYTLGVSFAVSDVEIVSRRTRYTVLQHQLLSFAFNTVFVALAMSVITSR